MLAACASSQKQTVFMHSMHRVYTVNSTHHAQNSKCKMSTVHNVHNAPGCSPPGGRLQHHKMVTTTDEHADLRPE